MIKTNLILLLMFSAMVGSVNFYGQGVNCGSATPAQMGANSTSPILAGEGTENICAFGTEALNAAWYTYTTTGDVALTVSSCLGGADTRLSVSTGDCGALTCVGFNDDFCEFIPGGDEWASSVTINADANTTYYIQWDDRWDVNGFDWTITEEELDCPKLFGNIGSPCVDGIISDACECVPETVPDCATLLSPSDGAVDVPINIDNNSVDLSFELNGFQPITGVDILFGDDPNNLEFLGTVSVSEVIVNITGLVPDTYYWSAVPTNSIGDALGCPVYSFTTDGLATDIPDCSTLIGPEDGALNVPLGGFDNQTVSLFWNNVTDGEPATALKVFFGDSFDSMSLIGSIDAGLETIDVNDVPPGGTYFWSIVPSNSFGDAIGCSVFSFTTSTDSDGDGVLDVVDNCPQNANVGQDDLDGDGIGNGCDDDIDGDGVLNLDDCEPKVASIFPGASCDDGDSTTENDMIHGDCTCAGTLIDSDGDGVTDVLDNCPYTNNPDQIDLDGDGRGDVCDNDIDGDGVLNGNDCAPKNAAIFAGVSCNDGDQITENDMIQNDCTCAGTVIDTDGDGITDSLDNCPSNANADQADLDGDGKGDLCDEDIDGDGIWNDFDCKPMDVEIYEGAPCDDGDVSTENDVVQEDCTCVGTDIQGDSDGDGIINDLDNCPNTFNTDQADVDGDGLGDVCDEDIDGDGVLNADDCAPADAALFPGAICDDGDPTTEDDLILQDCSCAGTPLCPTDVNGDGMTDGFDFGIFLGNFGLNCEESGSCPTDVNGDSITDGFDFGIFLGNFGLDCATSE